MKTTTYYLITGMTVLMLLFYPLSSTVAQSDYPTRPIEVIIPYPPGGNLDLAVRFYGEKWLEFLKQPIVTQNRPGGGATIGTKIAATSKPDGYTLLGASDTPLITARLGRKDIGYDLDNFRIYFKISDGPIFFTVKADSKWKTLNEFLSEAKQNPGKLKYASYAIGAITHYATVLLSQAAGANLTYLPYKSSPESLTALIGGHVDMAVTTGLSGMKGSPLIRPIAVAQEERLFDHPNVPTLKELGYPVVLNAMNVLCGPKGIPEEVVNKFVEAHLKVLAKYKAEIEEKIPRLDQYPFYMDGNSAMKVFKERERKYRELAPQIGIKLE